MNRTSRARGFTLIVVSMAFGSSCAWVGDTGSVKTATDLAVECKTDEALKALDRAERAGGLGMYLADLERIGILREAGREEEARRALETYRALPETASTSDQELEASISDFISELQKERLERTGKSTCD